MKICHGKNDKKNFITIFIIYDLIKYLTAAYLRAVHKQLR